MPLLHRADVLDGAVALLDAVGLDGVTTRKLGASLNLQGTAIYRHFDSKEALLDAMADRLLEGVAAPLPDGDWDEQLTVLVERMRAALLAHRDGARVVAGTYVAGPNTRLFEGVIFGILERAGVLVDRAGWVAFTIGHYVLGHAIEEQAEAHLSASGTWKAKLEAMTSHLDNDFERSAIKATFAAHPDDRFRFGFGLLLEGIRGQVEQPAARSGAQAAESAGRRARVDGSATGPSAQKRTSRAKRPRSS